MKLNQLRALVAISEKGSIHEAARHLHVSQPALSKTIQELEFALDAVLLTRSSTGTQLTPYGHRLVAHARLILESVKQARSDIQHMKGYVGGEITIGATPVAATLAPMVDALELFRASYPDIRLNVLEMRPAQLAEHLLQGLIDFAVTSEWSSRDPAYDATELCRRSSVIAARKGHQLAATRSLRVLQEAEWLSLDPLADTSSSFSRLFSENGLPIPLRVTVCTSVLLALELCSRSDTLLVLSAQSQGSPILTDHITLIEIDEIVPDQSFHLVKHRRQVLSGAAERLLEAMQAGFRASPVTM